MFKERESYKTKKLNYETDIYKKKTLSAKFKEQVKVYIFVARWLDGLVVKFSILKNEKGIYFSGLAAWWLFSRVT